MISSKKVLLATLSALVLAVGCETKETPVVSTTCYSDNAEMPLCDDPECDFTFDYFLKMEYPTAISCCPDAETEKAVIDSLTAFILNTAFGNEMVELAESGNIPGCKDIARRKDRVARVAGSIVKYNCNDFVKSNLPLWNKSGDAINLSWADNIESYFKGQYGSLISWIVYRRYYSGGAHGSDFEKCATYDTATGKRISEDDIFAEGFRRELGRLLSERAKEVLPSSTYNSLYDPEIAPNNNFFVSAKGITYCYGRYEIAPFGAGLIRIFLPWEKLEDILK